MNATELVVTVRQQDVAAVPLFVRRLHAWASTRLDGRWSITLATEPGVLVDEPLVGRTVVVPPFATPRQRWHFFDRRTSATSLVFLEVGPVDLDARLAPVLRHVLKDPQQQASALDTAPRFRDEALSRLLHRRPTHPAVAG